MNRGCFFAVLLLLAGCDSADRVGEFSDQEHYRRVSGEQNGQNCVEDLRSGLVWEVKSDEPGLHNWRNTYSWYNPTQSHNDIDYRGVENGGTCAGSVCDTWGIAATANDGRYCGFNDWRIPSKAELFSISDLRKADTPPTADTDYFPHMQSAEYWSANDYSFQPNSAWAWSFEFGHDRVDWKKSPKSVRLVRGSSSDLEAVKE